MPMLALTLLPVNILDVPLICVKFLVCAAMIDPEPSIAEPALNVIGSALRKV